MYKFSIPMPLSFDLIDQIENINSSLTKSKITSLYNCLPGNSDDLSGFEICRDFSKNKISFEEFSEYIKYAQEKGFDFTYLLNLFRNYNDDYAEKDIDKTLCLIEKLLNIGVRNIRVTSNELIYLIKEKFPEINIFTSTTQEYYNINQYINMLEDNKIKEIIPSWNENKNFKFLKNLNSLFPETNIELMLNEGCRFGCHLRLSHSIQTWNKLHKMDRKYNYFNYREHCQELSKKDFWLYICKSRIIYPWDLKEYNKIGINKFKFVGRNSIQFRTGIYIRIYKTWLMCIENPKILGKLKFRIFNHYITGNKDFDYTVEEIKPYLPKLNHFVKYGHLCNSICKKECNYCYKKAAKLKKIFGEI